MDEEKSFCIKLMIKSINYDIIELLNGMVICYI